MILLNVESIIKGVVSVNVGTVYSGNKAKRSSEGNKRTPQIIYTEAVDST